jgi:Flp pilus assembly protein TadG
MTMALAKLSKSNPMRLVALKRCERGGQLIEFALMSLLLFLLVFGITELGRAVWIYGTVAHLSREGARFAIVRGFDSRNRETPATAADVTAYVQSRAAGMTGLTVTTTWPDGDNEQGSVVQVRVSKPFESIVPLIPVGPITLTSTSRMVISF